MIASFAEDEIGLRWMFAEHFIEKAGDFILGKKSPLWNSTENRAELSMGGYNPPNFGPLVGLITKML